MCLNVLKKFCKKEILIFSSIIFIAILVRAPFVQRGLPYFYDEDEMNHFYLTTTMLQDGRFDPKYYRKPSLHFYMRIPVEAMAFIYGVKKGKIKNLKDIQIKNEHCLGKLSCTASHPFLVKASRGLSLIFSILTVVFIFLIAKKITNNFFIASLASLLFGMSPYQISLSTHIGVDPPVMLFCTISVFFAIKTFKDFSSLNLLLTSIFSGLAISTKYNAMPIYILPLVTLLFCKKFDAKNLLIAIFIPIISFLAVSPFLLIKYNLFLNEMASEVYHYSIAGHGGHEGIPGISQLIFYSKWFCNSGIGYIPFIFSIVGIVYLLKSKLGILSILFSIIYMFLMINQKVNFERNMFLILPCVCVFSVFGFNKILEFIKCKGLRIFVIALFIAQPLYQTGMLLKDKAFTNDTRNEVANWIKENANSSTNIFTSGKLGFTRDIYSLTNVASVSEKKDIKAFFMKGGDFLVFPSWLENKISPYFTPIKKFNGIDGEQRVYENPAIAIYKAKDFRSFDNAILKNIASNNKNILTPLTEGNGMLKISCDKMKSKDCFVGKKISLIDTRKFSENNYITSIRISYKSPWQNQKAYLKVGEDFYDIICDNLKPWESCTKEIALSSPLKASEIFFIVDKIFSPLQMGIGKDKRFLGLVVEN